MSSAICLNLDQSEILSSGNGLKLQSSLWIGSKQASSRHPKCDCFYDRRLKDRGEPCSTKESLVHVHDPSNTYRFLSNPYGSIIETF